MENNAASSMEVLGPFVLLGFFMFIAWAVNKFKGRPLVNGAIIFVWISVALMIWSAALILRPNHPVSIGIDPYYYLGQLFGSYFFPILLALYLDWRFRRQKKRVAADNANDNF